MIISTESTNKNRLTHTISKPSIINFIPKKDSSNTIFYGGTHFYIFIRFLFVLYERFLIAKQLSESFEKNDKTASLTSE